MLIEKSPWDQHLWGSEDGRTGEAGAELHAHTRAQARKVSSDPVGGLESASGQRLTVLALGYP